MSGHSKWSTIKRQKETKDKARGKLFSKLAKAISVAVKTGGGADPDSNYKLRIAIDAARQASMPKQNIERAISRSDTESESIEEVFYEGFGPSGIAVIVKVATDNRNRTGQEIKNVFERAGGNLAGPGSVSFNFESKGMILVKKGSDVEQQMLKLIDLGVEEMEESEDGIEIFTNPQELFNFSQKLEEAGFVIIKSELIEKPRNFIKIEDIEVAKKVLNFLDNLEEHEDVQDVYTNFDIPDALYSQIGLSQ
jgi:YebC/PmpR family DNA-binding regulatory protein